MYVCMYVCAYVQTAQHAWSVSLLADLVSDDPTPLRLTPVLHNREPYDKGLIWTPISTTYQTSQDIPIVNSAGGV